MDIHRCRFVPYPPASISALAFSHDSDLTKKAPQELRLALGRDNSDIEIWNPSGGRWLQETVLRGSVGSTIDQLAWTQDLVLDESDGPTVATPGALRLFSIGGSTSITEWSLTAGTRLRHAEGNSGDIWCFAPQPAYSLPKDGKIDGPVPGQILAAGCNNGAIILFSTDENELRYSQMLHAPTRRSKVLSVTWRDRNTVVAGYEDSMIRVFDVPSRKVIRQMSLGKSQDGSKSVVWSVKCLPDGTILSGDSSGELKIWDSQNLALAQRLKSHQADVLDIVTSQNGDRIFTFGVDRRTIAYQPLPMQPGQKKKRWAQAMHRRFHDHDVKCAASYESKGFSVFVSGGMDASPVIVPLNNWQSEYHRALSHLPQAPRMSTTRNRLLLAWWGRELSIYLISKRSNDGEIAEGYDDYILVATLQLKGEEHIQSAQISRDGSFVVTSTAKGVRLFQLRRTTSNNILTLRSRLIDLPLSLQDYGARHAGFSPNGKWLYAVRFDNTILLAKIMPSSDLKQPPSIHSRITRLEPSNDVDDDGPLRTYTDTVSTVTFSSDSRVLAVGNLSGQITSWALEGHEDFDSVISSQSSAASESGSGSDSDSDSDSDAEDESPLIHAQRWTRSAQLPRLDASVLLLIFRPSISPAASATTAPNHAQHSSPAHSNIALHPTRQTPHPVAHEHSTASALLALTSTHNLVELDITTGTFTPWSRRNPSDLLPARFKRIKDRAMGGFLHQQRLWLYGPSWLYMLDLSRDFPTTPAPELDLGGQVDGTSSSSKKRKRTAKEARGTGAGDKITSRRGRDVPFAPTGLKYHGDDGAMQVVDLDQRMAPASDDDDDMLEPNNTSDLVRLRRGEANNNNRSSSSPTTKSTTGDWAWRDNADGVRSHWFTFRYRSIFGIGLLRGGGYDDDDEESPDAQEDIVAAAVDGDVAMTGGAGSTTAVDGRGGGLEVVIVERPMYEVAQAPRFEGGQDWDA